MWTQVKTLLGSCILLSHLILFGVLFWGVFLLILATQGLISHPNIYLHKRKLGEKGARRPTPTSQGFELCHYISHVTLGKFIWSQSPASFNWIMGPWPKMHLFSTGEWSTYSPQGSPRSTSGKTMTSSDVKSWHIGKDPDAGKDWGQEEKGRTEDEVVEWHHWLNGHEFEQTPGGGEGKEAWCPARHWLQRVGHGWATKQQWHHEGFPGGLAVKNLPAMQETWVLSLGQEDPLEEGMATHSSILA